MSIVDKANKYIGHPREVDEGYEVSMRRDAYAQGYQDAIEKARQWFNLHFRQVGTPKEIKHDFESKERMWKSFTQFMEE